MNGDEAFVRSIVDRPGDDLPRLVYADWLYDLNDPRGAYLRAEREAIHTGDVVRSRELAAGLDPVWVARVSLPPVGVCIEHIAIVRQGPLVTTNDVDRLEKNRGITLPHDYRAFLLNYNGGLVELGDHDVPPEEQFEINFEFYSVARLTVRPLTNLDVAAVSSTRDPREAEWFSRFVCIGRDPDLINGILLGVSGIERGTVTHFDFSSDWTPELVERLYQPFSRTLAEYLATIGSSYG